MNEGNGPLTFNKKFQVGHICRTGSYNLIYTGEITNITEKCVFADGKRFTIAEFIWENYKFDLDKINAHNSNERMYI
jgi:hypothetical protein